jgi:hypothetical protein
MSRIPDAFLKSIAFIYYTEMGAHNQEDEGGTGFFYGVEIKPDAYSLYLVTNRHIVTSDTGTRPIYLQINTKDGESKTVTIEIEDEDWLFHPDGSDIAVHHLNIDPEIFDIGFIRKGIDIITLDMINRFNFGPGDEVYMIGRFVGMDKRNRVMPIVRYGHISSMPVDIIHPISHLKEESFIVDMHSRSGFSGSPVFIQFSNRIERHGSVMSGFWSGDNLLGINWGTREDKLIVMDDENFERKMSVKIPTNIIYVAPVWKIDEVIDSAE